ncbi:alpha/beta fold hydrolase [Paenibacillus sp. PL91]|uniref:alpha/beta fold hydrolase n=1 Tax=Paenibacillus sp. PL91 TaxID=2729538 RepID=UPI00145F5BBE|nr:alpha/beta fold hydrolase [Paenibacillus sp. PL91]MBC9203140.1 alpha/beta fold hydrolase [Paenibacillus sp. PL91]
MKPLYGKDSAIPSNKKIVFLGDSITDEGTFIAFMDAYFLQHLQGHHLTLVNLGVSSETASGLSEPEHPFPRPCVHERIDRALSECKPDWVVLCYGMNDGIYYPFSEDRFEAYQKGILSAIAKIKQAGAKAILMTPPPFDAKSFEAGSLMPIGQSSYSYASPFAQYEDVLKRYADWVLTLEGSADAIVPIHDQMLRLWEKKRETDPHYATGDGIHPNAEGHWLIASSLLRVLFNITLEQIPEYVLQPSSSALFRAVQQRHRLLSSAWKEHVGHTNPSKAEALPIELALQKGAIMASEIRERAAVPGNKNKIKTSVWKGYERVDFMLDGREGLLIFPKQFASGKPWVWRAEFFDAFAYADMALLEQGWVIAYYRLSNMYGCPGAVDRMHSFQSYVTNAFGLAPKTVLFGFSRGGLYAFNYAAKYPEHVKLLYLDAPVLNMLSWPGGKGEGTGAAIEWEECLSVYGMTEESFNLAGCSPLDRVDELAAASIPVLIVAGDADVPVPIAENAIPFEQRYRQLGGTIKLIVKPGVGHHPHSLEQPEPILAFIHAHAQH